MSLDNKKDIEMLSEDNVKRHTKDNKTFEMNKRKCIYDIDKGVNVTQERLQKYGLESYYNDHVIEEKEVEKEEVEKDDKRSEMKKFNNNKNKCMRDIKTVKMLLNNE